MDAGSKAERAWAQACALLEALLCWVVLKERSQCWWLLPPPDANLFSPHLSIAAQGMQRFAGCELLSQVLLLGEVGGWVRKGKAHPYLC